MSSNTRIKRKRELREVYIPQNAFIFQLPDETLLTIFKDLSVVDLIHAAGVCKWFRNIAYDEELWTTIDLTSKSCSNRILSKFFNLFSRDCTEILKISGGLIHRTLGKLPVFTGNINAQIHASYPNLRYLHIIQYDFPADQTTVTNITCLPPNLEGLYLKKCELSKKTSSGTVSFLQLPDNSTSNSSVQQIEILSFENSPCLKSESLSSLPNLCPKLIELNLNGCYRLEHKNILINTLISYSNTLRRLYLSETKINDDTIHSICRQLKRLNLLDIKQCRNVTINIIENLLTLKQLQKLIANNEIQILYNQRKQNMSDSIS